MNNILIAGDLVPKDNNNKYFENGELIPLLGKELSNLWRKSSLKIFNLEEPITNSKRKIEKCGPNFKANPKVIKGIKNLNPTLVLLGNNHIMDYDVDGLNDTIKILKENKIDYIGVGENTENMKSSYIISSENKKIGIYNCCDTEFSVATKTKSGANGYNALILSSEINKLKESSDYVVVLFHGGKERYRYPTPHLQEICRNMSDFGANLVVCQHTHCIGCYEDYNNSKIIYGQGNFIFSDYEDKCGDTSLIIEIDISNNFEIKYIPIKKTSNGTTLANAEEGQEILEDFEKRSKQIIQTDFVEKEYKKIVKNSFDSYLQKCHGDNLIYRCINKLFHHHFTKILYSKKALLALLNMVECESHRELLITCLKEKIYCSDKKETKYEN